MDPAHRDPASRFKPELISGTQTAESSNSSITILPNEILLEVTKLIAFPDTPSLRSTNRHLHAMMPSPPFFKLPLHVRFQIFNHLEDSDYLSLIATYHNIWQHTTPTRAQLATVESALESLHGAPQGLACYTCFRFLYAACFPVDLKAICDAGPPICEKAPHRQSSERRRGNRPWMCIVCLYFVMGFELRVCRRCGTCLDQEAVRSPEWFCREVGTWKKRWLDQSVKASDRGWIFKRVRQLQATKPVRYVICEACGDGEVE